VGQAALDAAADAGYRYLSFFAFPRAGKSFGAARFAGVYLLQPDFHVWIVAPTYPLGSKEFGYIWSDFNELGYLDWADPRHGGRKSFDPRSGHMEIQFPWGSFLKVVSADNPVSLRAEEVDLLILAEASGLQKDIYDRHLLMRTAKRKGITLVPTTPMGKNWIYDTFRVPSRKVDKNGAPNPFYNPRFWSCVVSADPDLIDPTDWDLADIYEPGVYAPEEVAQAKLSLPTPVYTEQVGGGFASYAGRVLPYDPRFHRCKPFDIPDHWTHIVGWDHGSSPSKTAILIGSYDPRGVLYWWAELYTTGWTAQEYWEWVKRTLGPNKAVSLVAVDPSAKQVRIELSGLSVASNIPHDKQIEAGVIRLTQLMNLNQFKIFEGTCKEFEREMNRMEWDEKNPKKILNDHIYHACSAARYATLITVPLPVDPDGPLMPVIPKNDPKAYWREVAKLRWKQAGDKFTAKLARQTQIEQIDAMDETLNPDVLADGIGIAVEEFDVESYFDD